MFRVTTDDPFNSSEPGSLDPFGPLGLRPVPSQAWWNLKPPRRHPCEMFKTFVEQQVRQQKTEWHGEKNYPEHARNCGDLNTMMLVRLRHVSCVSWLHQQQSH